MGSVAEHRRPGPFRRIGDPVQCTGSTLKSEGPSPQGPIAIEAGLTAPAAALAAIAPVLAHRASADEEALEDESVGLPPAVVAAPGWLADLRRGDHRRGFYQSFDDCAVHFVQRSNEHLVVSFDNLSSVRDHPVDRDSWGYGFIRTGGWSHLGVMAFKPTWFRDDDLIGYLKGLAGDGFFRRFASVTMIGTSMGAYAATAFASLAPGCGVVAFSPQSTLRKTLVPWEKRFPSGRRADWSGDFADGAVESEAAAQVWLIYDPLCEEDRRHVARYQGGNVVRLKARYAGHKSALFLRRAGLLSKVTGAAVEGTLDQVGFYQMYRRGRTLPWYLNGVANRIGASGRIDRLRRCQSIMTRMGRPQIARAIDVRFPDLLALPTQKA